MSKDVESAPRLTGAERRRNFFLFVMPGLRRGRGELPEKSNSWPDAVALLLVCVFAAVAVLLVYVALKHR